jgi:hypothetical protein
MLLPLVPVLFQWGHSSTSYLLKIRFNIPLFIPGSFKFHSDVFPSRFPTKTLYVFHLSPICVTSPAHLIRFNLIIIVIFGEEYKLWSSWSWNFSAASCFSLLNPNIHPITLFSYPPPPVLPFFLMVSSKLKFKFQSYRKQRIPNPSFPESLFSKNQNLRIPTLPKKIYIIIWRRNLYFLL